MVTNVEVVHRGMLKRSVDPTRYRGLVRQDKTVQWAMDELERVEQMRGRSPDAWPSPTALPKSLGRLAELLTELGWDDLACLALREGLTAYRELDATRPGTFLDETHQTLDELRKNLIGIGRYKEALEVVDELLRQSRTGQSAQVKASAQEWRTVILDQLGRNEEALRSAAMAVNQIRERLGDAPVDLELSHALTTYAKQLDKVGRVAEAAEVTSEVAAYWREQDDATVQFLRMVSWLSNRLVRSGQSEEAGARITEAMQKALHGEDHWQLAPTWHDFSDRLLSVGLADEALVAGEKAVKLYREIAHGARAQHREAEADDWDDDHRYSQSHLYEQWRRKVESSQERLHEAEQNLHNGLLNLSACLRQLDRINEATAAETEAARLR